jgi:hypothetical protein
LDHLGLKRVEFLPKFWFLQASINGPLSDAGFFGGLGWGGTSRQGHQDGIFGFLPPSGRHSLLRIQSDSICSLPTSPLPSK